VYSADKDGMEAEAVKGQWKAQSCHDSPSRADDEENFPKFCMLS